MDSFYQQKIKDSQTKLKERQKQYSLIGNLKLLNFLALIISAIIFINRPNYLPLGILAGLLLIVLIYLFYYQLKLKKQLHYQQQIIIICQNYLAKIEGDFSKTYSQPLIEVVKGHPYAADLDINGPNSLFNLLNLSHNYYGQAALSAALLNADFDLPMLKERQTAIAELAIAKDLACHFEYLSAGLNFKGNIEQIINRLADGNYFGQNSPLKYLAKGLPILTLSALALALLFNSNILNIIALAVFLAQAATWLLFSLKTNNYLAGASLAPTLFYHYEEMFICLQKQDFKASLLQNIKQNIGIGQDSAIAASHKLAKIINRTHLRSNGLFYLIMNLFLLWDLNCAMDLGRWKKDFGSKVKTWINDLASFESLLSLASMANICNNCSLPIISEQKYQLRAKNLGHPLLNNQKRVNNDLDMTDNIIIISGSNMAGKTTFLRSLGINLILAYSGGFVCAEHLECSRYQVMSSMRIADDLQGGISTFYAELKRIRAIVETARQSDNLLFLVDEIFRGTNSEDRIYGAKEVILELAHNQAMGIITSHDLAICDLALTEKRVKNYSFREIYEQDTMFFDYSLQNGKSTSTNAAFLMKQIGILR